MAEEGDGGVYLGHRAQDAGLRVEGEEENGRRGEWEKVEFRDEGAVGIPIAIGRQLAIGSG